MNRRLTYISTEYLHPHPDNPRKDLGDLTELSESLKVSGIMQNLTVVPRAEGGYTVIIGHRRLGAAKLAGIESVPCVITEMTKKDQLATMMLENMQRSDLTYYEQAEGFQLMMDFGESIESIAEKTGLSKATVRNRVKLAAYDREIMREAALRQPTLEQYMSLSEIEDKEKANYVARFLGTKNFDHELSRALSQQKEQKNRAELEAIVKSVATKYEGDIYKAVQEHKIINVDHVYTPASDATKEKLAKLSEQYGTLYYNDGYGFGIFRDYVSGDDDKKTEYEIMKAKREELDKRGDDLYDSMYGRAAAFVHSYKSKKEHYDILTAHLVNAVCEKTLSAYHQIFDVAKALGWTMPDGAQTWEENVRIEAECFVEEQFEKDKPRTLLLMLWHMLPESKPFELRYNEKKFTTKKGGGGWCRIFGILSDVGYNVSDEEWSILWGKHPLFEEEVSLL